MPTKNKILDGISPQMVIILAKPPQTVIAAYRRSAITLMNFMTMFTQYCYTAVAEAASFLRSSCSHLQVQTVPSSTWDAPCPVVTPSLVKGLGSALSVKSQNNLCKMYFFNSTPRRRMRP